MTGIFTADTVVLTHALPSVHRTEFRAGQDLLEKPCSKEDQLRMLMDLNGNVCEVVTAVSLGASVILAIQIGCDVSSVYPILTAPGYATR